MPGNSFGQQFRITTFGESHGAMIGVVIDGCPAGIPFDLPLLQADLDKRRPGFSALSSPRKESDTAQVVSGIFEGFTTGTPIAILLQNEDVRSEDYDHLRHTYRPSHADFTYEARFGRRDHRGGGRSSARETAARVAAGAVARMYLRTQGVQVWAYVQSLGKIELPLSYLSYSPFQVQTDLLRCPDPEISIQMQAVIETSRQKGDTVGGKIIGVVQGAPAGLGDPVFDKLHADLGKAILSINACKGFEIGDGFSSTQHSGSENNDAFVALAGKIGTKTNRSGGIQGGISNGEDIWFSAAFKPVSTLLQPQDSVNTAGEAVVLEGKGRHDPTVLPRAVPIVEAMTCLVIADHLLRFQLAKI